jgi:hypothetical protein
MVTGDIPDSWQHSRLLASLAPSSTLAVPSLMTEGMAFHNCDIHYSPSGGRRRAAKNHAEYDCFGECTTARICNGMLRIMNGLASDDSSRP